MVTERITAEGEKVFVLTINLQPPYSVPTQERLQELTYFITDAFGKDGIHCIQRTVNFGEAARCLSGGIVDEDARATLADGIQAFMPVNEDVGYNDEDWRITRDMLRTHDRRDISTLLTRFREMRVVLYRYLDFDEKRREDVKLQKLENGIETIFGRYKGLHGVLLSSVLLERVRNVIGGFEKVEDFVGCEDMMGWLWQESFSIRDQVDAYLNNSVRYPRNEYPRVLQPETIVGALLTGELDLEPCQKIERVQLGPKHAEVGVGY